MTEPSWQVNSVLIAAMLVAAHSAGGHAQGALAVRGGVADPAASGTAREVSNPQTLRLDYPQGASNAFDRERPDRASEAFERTLDRLVTRAQDNDARRASGVVAANIGEVSVEGNQDPAFDFADHLNFRVHGSFQALVVDIMYIPTARGQRLTRRPWQILIELEPHPQAGIGTTRSWARAAA